MLVTRKSVNLSVSRSAENVSCPAKGERRCDKVQDIEFLIEDHSDWKQAEVETNNEVKRDGKCCNLLKIVYFPIYLYYYISLLTMAEESFIFHLLNTETSLSSFPGFVFLDQIQK